MRRHKLPFIHALLGVALLLGTGCVSSEGADPGGDSSGAQSSPATQSQEQYDGTWSGFLDVGVEGWGSGSGGWWTVEETDAVRVHITNTDPEHPVYLDTSSFKLGKKNWRHDHSVPETIDPTLVKVTPFTHPIVELGVDVFTIDLKPPAGETQWDLADYYVFFSYSHITNSSLTSIGDAGNAIIIAQSSPFTTQVPDAYAKVAVWKDAEGHLTVELKNDRPAGRSDSYTYAVTYIEAEWIWKDNRGFRLDKPLEWESEGPDWDATGEILQTDNMVKVQPDHSYQWEIDYPGDGDYNIWISAYVLGQDGKVIQAKSAQYQYFQAFKTCDGSVGMCGEYVYE
jgi:hypothetical protein